MTDATARDRRSSIDGFLHICPVAHAHVCGKMWPQFATPQAEALPIRPALLFAPLTTTELHGGEHEPRLDHCLRFE